MESMFTVSVHRKEVSKIKCLLGTFGYLVEVQCSRCSIKFSIDVTLYINVIVLMPIKRILHNFSHFDPSIEKDVNYQFIEMTQDIQKQKKSITVLPSKSTFLVKIDVLVV